MSTIPLASHPRSPSLTRGLALAARRPGIWLGMIISLSFVARLTAAWSHTSPRTFPDEYLYTAIARSLAAGDGLTIRGNAAHFPALLESLLTAPLWLVGDTTAAFRLTQVVHIAAMSLAALPIYWLARRIGAPSWQALGCAAFTVALPTLLFASYMTADALAYPLALGALAAGTSSLDRSTHRGQLLFIALAGLAAFTRVQYVIIPVAYVLAALVLDRGRVRTVVRRQWIVVAAASLPVLAAVMLGPSRLLGYYRGVLDLGVSPFDLAHWLAVDAMLLCFAAGIVLVPGAIVGLYEGWRRRAPGAHRAFAILTTFFIALLLAEAALYATNGSGRFQERYLITILPLVSVAFCASVRALPHGRRAIAIAAVGLALLSMRVPLSGFTVLDGKQDSPFLMAVSRLEDAMSVGAGSLLVAAVVALLAAIAVLAAFRPRIGVPVALAAAVAVSAATSLGASSLDGASAARFETTFADRGNWTWIDDEGLGKGSVLVLPGADRNAAEAHLFWNRSLDSVLRMSRAPGIDPYGDIPTTVTAAGDLVAGGRGVSGALLVEEAYAQATFDDARLVRRTPGASVWLPEGDAHLSMLAVGRYVDGWIDRYAEIIVWPRQNAPREGAVRLKLSLPAGLPKAVIAVSGPGIERDVVVRSSHPVVLVVPFRAEAGPIRIALRGKTGFRDGSRTVVARIDRPQLVPDLRR